ncbi:MAG: aldehyde dehydrogenase family protein [Elainellaceae cyanobacterium]
MNQSNQSLKIGKCDTPIETANLIIARLHEQRDRWVKTDIQERLQILRQCMVNMHRVADTWVKVVCQIKGIPDGAALEGEVWMTGPSAVLRNLRLLIHALEAGGQPQAKQIRTRPDGQAIAQVFPDTWIDRLSLLGYAAEIWIEPGRSPSQGAPYRHPPDRGRVGLVLGAGNISSIGPMDALYKLFAEHQVVILKMHPLLNALGAVIETAFQPLIERSVLAVVYGGGELGQYLCHHSEVDTIHITGSHHTHDCIVWGNSPTEQRDRPPSQTPALTKPITSELGCVTPILVVPGEWTSSDLEFQAQHVANMLVHNASFNCVAGKVVVMAKGWAQRADFLDCLHRAIAAMPPRPSYYPGAFQRYQAFLDCYPQSILLGSAADGCIPWTVIPDVMPKKGEYALSHEAFCGVLAEVTLEVDHPSDFLERAVAFVNQSVWGNLSCSLLIDPKTATRCADELEEAIAQLRYGTIALNTWPGIAYSLGVLPWGAFPGNPLDDIESGRGIVHNAYLFDYPQKSVLRAPFRVLSTPFWFTNHRNLRQVGQRLTALEARQTWATFIPLAIAAIPG